VQPPQLSAVTLVYNQQLLLMSGDVETALLNSLAIGCSLYRSGVSPLSRFSTNIGLRQVIEEIVI